MSFPLNTSLLAAFPVIRDVSIVLFLLESPNVAKVVNMR